MKIKSPFADRKDFEYYLDYKYFNRRGNTTAGYLTAISAINNPMNEEELRLYKQYYEAFEKEYNLEVSKRRCWESNKK